MAQKFDSFQKIIDQFPGVWEMVNLENKIQYPHATFIKSVVSEIYPDNNQEIMILFDIGIPNKILWVCVVGDLTDPVSNNGAYIDEYYEVSFEEGIRYLNLLKEDEENLIKYEY